MFANPAPGGRVAMFVTFGPEFGGDFKSVTISGDDATVLADQLMADGRAAEAAEVAAAAKAGQP